MQNVVHILRDTRTWNETAMKRMKRKRRHEDGEGHTSCQRPITTRRGFLCISKQAQRLWAGPGGDRKRRTGRVCAHILFRTQWKRGR